jgi:hypothetical protein
MTLDQMMESFTGCVAPDERTAHQVSGGALVRRYLEERSTAKIVNTKTTFLFPGNRPGAHVIAAQIRWRLNQLGITRVERQGALSYLVSEVPPFNRRQVHRLYPDATSRRTIQAGSDWGNYVALKTELPK